MLLHIAGNIKVNFLSCYTCKFHPTFWHVDINAGRFCVACRARVVARVVDLWLTDDQPALGPWSGYGFDGDVPPGVVVVDHPVVALPVHVLWRLRTLKNRWSFVVCQSSKRDTKALTFSIIHTKLMADPMSTCSSPEPRMKASGTTTCRFTKCEITPVDVETCVSRNEKKLGYSNSWLLNF
jgi:hypothetical protein